MKAQMIAVMAIGTLVGCSSSVVINSSPTGAKCYVDGALVGTTPVTYTDGAIVGTVHVVELKKVGYQDKMARFSRNSQFNAGACIGGFLVLVPFLWIMDYPPALTYELEPVEQASLRLPVWEGDRLVSSP